MLTSRRTYRGAFSLPINGIDRSEDKHKPEKKGEEQKGVENHAVREPPRSDLHFEELPKAFRRQHSNVPQARRYVKLHLRERKDGITESGVRLKPPPQSRKLQGKYEIEKK